MDKSTWLDLDQEARNVYIKPLLSQLVELDRVKALKLRAKDRTTVHTNRFKLEQEILQLLDWEKEETEEGS